ncbi:MAG: hypothetical protein MUD07_10415 [Burkholderiaceae bacterium]|nr:hypothetical protein [Burkholderiaceae bacterium]
MAAGAGLRAGTTGIGGDIAVEVLPTLSARVGYSYLSFSTTVDSSDVEYDARPKLSNGNLFLDWSPLGPFRITGGLILNSNKIDVTAVPTGGTLTINGVVYPAASIGSLSGTVESGKSAAPYLGIGYGNVSGAGVNFYFDLGVMLTCRTASTISSTTPSSTSGSRSVSSHARGRSNRGCVVDSRLRARSSVG